MNKKYKLIIVLSSILLVLFIIAGIVVISKRINKTDSPNNNVSNKEEGYSEEQQLKDILYNNFLIAYLLEADIKTGDGTLTINGEQGVYYTVTDYLLENIHSLKDINDLIEENLDDVTIIRTKKFMQSEYSNKFTESNGVLYVKKSISPCEVNNNEDITKDNISVSIQKDRYTLFYKGIPYSPYKTDDNKIKVSTLWFNCMPNFTKIGLDADSYYDHDAVYEDETQVIE